MPGSNWLRDSRGRLVPPTAPHPPLPGPSALPAGTFTSLYLSLSVPGALLSCHIPPWQPPCEQAPGHMPWPAHGPSSLLSEGPHWHFPGSPSGSSELRAQDICESSQGQGGPSCGTTSHLCAVVTLERIRPGRERLGAVRTAGTGRDGEGARLACLMGHLTSHGEESQTKGRPCAVGHLPGSRAGLPRLTVLSRADLMPFSPTPMHPRLQ